MFCSECGVEAAGKFCWSCGRRLKQQPATANGPQKLPEPAVDWTNLLDCQALLAIPEVRERIAQYAARATKRLSGEDFLEGCDKVLSSLTCGVPLTLIAKIAQPLNKKLGLKTGKERCERLAERPGSMIVALLCSLAENGHSLVEATQLNDVATIRATIASDIWSFAGELIAKVHVEGTTTIVEAGLTIPGQLYDWGKANRILDRLFTDLRSTAQAA